MQTIGYNLVEASSGDVVKTWGGSSGQSMSVPNPIPLPNGVVVYSPEVGGEYSGYILEAITEDEPAPNPPLSITRRQCSMQLFIMGMITNNEAVEMARSGVPPAAVQVEFDKMSEPNRTFAAIDFAAANYYRNNPLIPDLMAANGMSPEQVDQFFIAASFL